MNFLTHNTARPPALVRYAPSAEERIYQELSRIFADIRRRGDEYAKAKSDEHKEMGVK